MAIDTQNRKKVDYFIGTEIENTIMKGKSTLFVVGVKPINDIVNLAQKNNIKHIYLGTSQSFTPSANEEWLEWDNLILNLLNKEFWVTLDFGVEYSNDIHEFGWNDYDNFIPMISVKLPYIKLFNYNATIKIDDNTWGHSNPGVWCHPLNELLTRETFTAWDHYVGDTPIGEQE